MYEQLGRHVAERFKIGGGMLSADKSYVMINIPKNASSYVSTWLHENGWSFIDYTHHEDLVSKVKTVGVILRDPINRFCTGFVQYFKSNVVQPIWSKNFQAFTIEDIKAQWPVIERLMADVAILFDDHTMPQYYFYESFLPNVTREYFYCNQYLDQTLQKHFNLATPTAKAEQDANITAMKVDEKGGNINMQILELVKHSVEKPEIKSRLMQTLQQDYQKIMSTQFIRYK